MSENTYQLKLAWLGGIVDGEGSIGVYIATKLNKLTGQRERKQLIGFANISNCDERLIRVAADILAQAGIKTVLHLHPQRGNRSPCWYLMIAGMKQVAVFLELLLPYLVVKKERAELILSIIRHRKATMDERTSFGPRSSPWNDQWLMGQLSQLQSTGRQGPRSGLSTAG